MIAQTNAPAARTSTFPLIGSALPTAGRRGRGGLLHALKGWGESFSAAVPALPARTVQEHLSACGYLAPSAISGRFDAATAAAVRRFQEDRDLAIDGVPGRATAALLLLAA